VTAAKILVVEDDESLGMVLVDALAQEGYRASLERDGVAAFAKATSARHDLILLDLMLPGLDGYEICRRLRKAGDRTPVLMLTARGREEDRVKGLDLGADDYVTKPFSLRELLARVRARLRAADAVLPDVIRMGGAVVDFSAHLVRRENGTSRLTKTEAAMLRLFAKNPGTVLSRNRFLDEIWGMDAYPTTRTVDMHLARVRDKIGDDGDDARVLRTVHGVGYRYDPSPGDGKPPPDVSSV
jgi:DNA-binding response OmpR family regulator